MMNEVSNMIQQMAQEMPTEALRAAARECLEWGSNQPIPTGGRLSEMVVRTHDAFPGPEGEERVTIAAAAVNQEVLRRFVHLAPTPD